MKKFQFWVNSLLVLVTIGLLLNAHDSFGKKKQKKVTKSSLSKKKLTEMPEPGVPNKASLDSLKQAKMKTKKASLFASSDKTIVSFISKGEGIDNESLAIFEKLVVKYQNNRSCTYSFELKTWGREGERDYCVSALSNDCLADFTYEIQQQFSKKDRVLIEKNKTCKH